MIAIQVNLFLKPDFISNTIVTALILIPTESYWDRPCGILKHFSMIRE